MNAKEKEQVVLAIEELGRSVSLAQVAKTRGLNGNLVFSALRFVYIAASNNEIEERNTLRKYFAEILHKPNDPLFQKLLERNECQLEEMLIQSRPEDVVYTTQKALDEQDFDMRP